jgi:hypothetical protein
LSPHTAEDKHSNATIILLLLYAELAVSSNTKHRCSSFRTLQLKASAVVRQLAAQNDICTMLHSAPPTLVAHALN